MEDIATQTADAQVNLQNSIKNYQTSRHGIKIWQELKDFVNDRGGNVLDLGIGDIDNFFIVIQKGRTRNATYHTPQEAAQDGAVYVWR
ncbi:hypothetical protein BC938DRAFT_480443 [Jimgerdemannia flammicorona]|uniref:Uncharacterized protein n=1 Tax=Jimgerdemannia flammicorona TaxID=994334 RepID=A0A433QIN0_9FUNG|nr:hypothetical protein BC938DRAFT_480443 [Jimgerdemannia flammicorona]